MTPFRREFAFVARRRVGAYAIILGAALACFAAQFSRPAAAGDPASTYDLRRKYVPELEGYYLLDRQQSEAQSISLLLPTPLVTRQHTIEEFRETVIEPQPPDAFQVNFILERLQFQKSDRKREIRYDSITDSPTAETALPATLIGHPMAVRLTPTGHGRATPSASAPAASQPAAIPAPPPPAEVPVASRGTADPRLKPSASRPAAARPVQPRRPPPNDFDRDRVQERIVRWTQEFLPDHPVRAGDSWWLHYDETRMNFVTLHHDLQFTLEEVRPESGRDVARISLKGQCRAEISQEAAPAENQTRTVKLKNGVWSGELYFDMQRGGLDRAALRHDHDLSSEMKSTNKGIDITLGVSAQRIWSIKYSRYPAPRPIVVQSSRPAAVHGRPGRPVTPPRVVPPGAPATRPDSSRSRPGAQ